MRYGLRVSAYSLVAALALGCGASALKEGTYNIEVQEVVSETCGLSDEEYGVGDAELFALHWEDDALVFTGAGDAHGTYTWDGESGFTHAFYEINEVEGTSCSVRAEKALEGTILSDTSFEIESDTYLSTEGNCSNVDTTGIPCSAVVLLRGELVE